MIMNQHLEQLIEIAKDDAAIDQLDLELCARRKELDETIAKKEGKEREILGCEDLMRECGLLIAKHELNLKDFSQKLEDKEAKLALAKSEREINSLNMEKNIINEQVNNANEEIERLNKAIERARADIENYKEMLVEMEADILAREDSLSLEIAEIRTRQEAITIDKNKICENIDNKVFVFYEKIRNWAHDSAVVSTYKKACGGCFIRLNDRIYSDILRGDNINTCPHCGRIIYVSEAELARIGEEELANKEKEKKKSSKAHPSEKVASKG